MSAISNLFENLMTYNDVNATEKRTKKVIKENDSTLLNLTVELPADTEEITPEDVKVDVGVMTVDTDGVPVDEENPEKVEEPKEGGEATDVTPEPEDVPAEEPEEPEKEESLDLTQEGAKTCTGKKDCECEACKAKVNDEEKIEEGSDFETAAAKIRKRVTGATECTEVKESLMHLDTTSLNKLFTQFVKDNYKNIDKVVISKAVLENKMLKLEGAIYDVNGESEKVSFTNRGFDAVKLENKRFVMDFKDNLGTFGIVKESVKKPFVFTATLKEGILSFESLKYSFKTMCESKTAEVYGDIKYVKESVEPKNENADQVKKFNEIAEKIKNAKSANDLSECKDLMDDSNVGDTLLSALQMIWDDVNSRMVAATKNK